MAGVTLAEVVRRLDDVVKRLDRLVDTQEATYVRKDVYDARTDSLVERVEVLETTAANNRRLIISSFVAPIVVGIVVVLILSALGVHK